MKTLEFNLSEVEKKIIQNTLENNISDLSMEITNTDKMEYREKLKFKRNVLQKFLNSLNEQFN